MLNTINVIPLLSKYKENFSGATTYDHHYITCQPNKSLMLKYDEHGSNVKEVATMIPYASISYVGNNLFVATCVNDYKNLFLINEKYEKVNTISLNIPKFYEGIINNVFYDQDCHQTIITNNQCIYAVDDCGNYLSYKITQETTHSLLKNHSESCVCEAHPCINNYYTSTAMIANHLFVAYTKNHSAYIAQISCNGNLISNHYIDEFIIIHSMFMVDDCLQFIASNAQGENCLYHTNFGYVDDSSCNHNHQNGCNDIMESIALIEAALSHILNAEGEKIQKVVALASDPCELLAVNKSVTKLIKNVTFLELVLYQKLELAKQCSEGECD
ncbi:MAG: hypothetical protein RR863_03060 [Erysipelotrichaceae bacterium]